MTTKDDYTELFGVMFPNDDALFLAEMKPIHDGVAGIAEMLKK